MLEASLARALEAAHDAQTVALQLSGERQALQMQLAAGANEVAVLRQMVAAVEREHREATQRIQERADDEIGQARARLEVQIEEIKASERAGGMDSEDKTSAAARRDGGQGSETRPLSPSKNRFHPSRSVGGGRAEAERRLEQLQRDYSALAVSGSDMGFGFQAIRLYSEPSYHDIKP